MNRRGFLQSILAAAIAPAVVKAASLMPVRQLESGLVVPEFGWVDHGLPLVDPDLRFVVPDGISTVWLTCTGGGGGGGRANVNSPMVSPFENAAGDIVMKPVRVRPGEVIPTSVGRNGSGGNGEDRYTFFQWIDEHGTLNGQEFVAPPHQKELELSSRTLYARNT